jgi:hypothetical protein
MPRVIMSKEYDHVGNIHTRFNDECLIACRLFITLFRYGDYKTMHVMQTNTHVRSTESDIVEALGLTSHPQLHSQRLIRTHSRLGIHPQLESIDTCETFACEKRDVCVAERVRRLKNTIFDYRSDRHGKPYLLRQ